MGYAGILAEKFDYTNTQYDREPRMDLTESHPKLHGTYDFILCADVLEHIAPPIERALDESCRLLKPHGFLGITVFCNPADRLREHFPGLNQFRIVPLGDSTVLINRRTDGALEIRDDLIFHGGTGTTLEMREFGATSKRETARRRVQRRTLADRERSADRDTFRPRRFSAAHRPQSALCDGEVDDKRDARPMAKGVHSGCDFADSNKDGSRFPLAQARPEVRCRARLHFRLNVPNTIPSSRVSPPRRKTRLTSMLTSIHS